MDQTEVIMKQTRELFRLFQTSPKDVPVSITAGLEDLYNKHIIGRKGPEDFITGIKISSQDAFAGIALLLQAKLGACDQSTYGFTNFSESALNTIRGVWETAKKFDPSELLTVRTGGANYDALSLS